MNTCLPHHLSRSAKIALSWLAVAVMAAAIFWMSANSGESINSGLGIVSAIKGMLSAGAQWIFGHEVDVSPVGHFTEYLVFGALLFNALRFHLNPRIALLAALAIGSLYGITDEWHQLFVPSRSCDPADWAVDTVATLVGSALTRFGFRKTKEPAIRRVLSRSHSCPKARDFESAQLPANKRTKQWQHPNMSPKRTLPMKRCRSSSPEVLLPLS